MTNTEMTVDSIHMALKRESENDPLQELPGNYYQAASSILGKMTQQEYDGVEGKINTRLSKIASELIIMLLRIRLNKISNNSKSDKTNLLDVEKFILDSGIDMDSRKNMILDSVLHGKSKLLESVAFAQKTKPVLVRFLKDAEQIVGSDMAKYGPFNKEDIASIPYDNAQAFIIKNIAVQVVVDDKQSS